MESPCLELLINQFCPRGFGVAQNGRFQVEVAHAIIGDRINVKLCRRRHRVQKGRLIEVISPSVDRIDARCPHATLCGGCCWQIMNYQAQVRYKQEWISCLFDGLSDLQTDIRPLIICETAWRYRNKMEFSFSENRAGSRFLGLMIAHAEPYVFNVERCLIAPEWMSDCLARVRAWWEESKLSAYNPSQNWGSLRYLTLRDGLHTNDRMAILNVSGNPEFALSRAQMDSFIQAVGPAASVFLRIHQISKGVPSQFFEIHLSGKDHIMEQLHLLHRKIDLKISPASFFQPNTLQAEKLYNSVLSMLGGNPIVFDLYCGTGTLSVMAALSSRQVIGIELSAEAVLDAEQNARQNGLRNIQFIQGDVGEILARLMANDDFVRPNAVIVDPPRAGLDSLALRHLKTLQPEKIVYVSCNPVTQAGNVRELLQAGYKIQCMQAVDQFPHTAHIEHIVLLEPSSRRSGC
jgi:23S rRNA (uracil1939-C5)-methyltransferase